MTVLVVRKYFPGEHYNIMIQVLFGMIALIFLINPTVFFGVLNWLIGKLPHS
jgi:nitric oxide reductase large subunit